MQRPAGEPQWIVRDGRRLDPTLAWYRWVGPAEVAAKLPYSSVHVSGVTGSLPPENHVLVELLLRPSLQAPQYGGICLYLDGEGREVGRHPGDPYKIRRDSGELPDEAVFTWLDYESLPPPQVTEAPFRQPGQQGGAGPEAR